MSSTWQRFREELFDDPASGFRLDVSRMDIPEESWRRSEGAFRQALEAMNRLEAGALANPDEQRMVGHYWLRAPELAPTDEIRDAIRDTRDRVLHFARSTHRGEIGPARHERFERFLLIGIGGSALGPQFVAEALAEPTDRMTPHFLDNTDPDGIDRVLDAIGGELDRTLTIVVSKSGGTPETRNGMLEAKARYESASLRFSDHAVAITQAGSKLHGFASDPAFLATFPMWDWVGGRTSVMSAVGLLPAALQGGDVLAMLDGAAAMDRLTRVANPRRNPAALLAMAWFEAGSGQGAKDMVILPYKDRLALFSRYLQQLVMESLGKEKNKSGETVHQGIAVYGNKGSTDQHAYVQQLRDGLPNFFATFLQVARDREGAGIEVDEGVTSGDYLHGFMLGTRQALYENGRKSLTITIPRVDAASVGALIALYERAVGLYAELIGVNAYHQPGVEAGKKAAASVLDLQRKLVELISGKTDGAGSTAEELAHAVGEPDQVETVFHLLERLSFNPERGIVRETADGPFAARFRIG